MKPEELKWLEEAMKVCTTATEQGIYVLLLRRSNDEPDYVLTNAKEAAVIDALARAIPMTVEAAK